MDLSFRGLLSYARRHDIETVDALAAATGCGTRCGSCRPYIQQMLRTGEVPTSESITADAPTQWGQ